MRVRVQRLIFGVFLESDGFEIDFKFYLFFWILMCRMMLVCLSSIEIGNLMCLLYVLCLLLMLLD